MNTYKPKTQNTTWSEQSSFVHATNMKEKCYCSTTTMSPGEKFAKCKQDLEQKKLTVDFAPFTCGPNTYSQHCH